jgi:hypothetical protein
MLPPTLHLRVRCLAAGAGAMLLTCTLARAGQEPVRPNAAPPVIQAASATTPPVIDGVLDDPCWQDATHIEEFRREKVDAPALERTEAWICCDGDAIYAAFRCHDSKPAEIRCDQKKRQGHI